ncbi:MAG: hypothetical protein AAF623_19920 [Planctomycetota bacterium]
MKIEKSIVFVLLIAATALFGSGCNNEKVKELVDKAKDAANDLSEKGTEALNTAKDSASKLTTGAGNLISMNGKANFKLDSPTDFPASFVRVIPLYNGTHVVQIKSYKDGQEDTYPSFLIQGLVEPASVEGLSGQSVPCQLFAQLSDGSDVWTNAAGQDVIINFSRQNDQITASFSNATIVNTQTGSQAASSGTFECVRLD